MALTEMHVSLVALVVALGSAAASGWAARRSVRIAEKQTALQEHMPRLEQARERDRLASATRAVPRAQLATKESVVLLVSNESDVDARSVRITLDGEPVERHGLFRAPPSLDVLGPGASVNLRMLTYDGMPHSYRIGLSWEDRSSVPGEWASDLTVS
jgi:hypothetical protein